MDTCIHTYIKSFITWFIWKAATWYYINNKTLKGGTFYYYYSEMYSVLLISW